MRWSPGSETPRAEMRENTAAAVDGIHILNDFNIAVLACLIFHNFNVLLSFCLY